MPATDRSLRRCGELGQYEIRVQGHLADRWAERLDVLTLTRERDGTTTLRSPPLDQAALHGLLARIRDLGPPLVAMRRLCPNHDAGHATDDQDEGLA
jgi:hypothetical protein